MYVFAQENEHDVWKEWCYTFTLGVSLRIDFYMIYKDKVFVVDVIVTNLTWETLPINVINWPTCVNVKFNVIVKICM
jgi:hypothetical protein